MVRAKASESAVADMGAGEWTRRGPTRLGPAGPRPDAGTMQEDTAK